MDLDWDMLCRPRQTIVIYMGLKGLPLLCEALIKHVITSYSIHYTKLYDILTSAIAEVDGAITATLVDGSADMLKKAEERLTSYNFV